MWNFRAPWIVCVAAPLAFVVGLTGTANRSWNVNTQDVKGPHWIWGSWALDMNRPAGERCYFRKVFTVPEGKSIAKATLSAACDDHFIAWVNGERVGSGDTWTTLATFDVVKQLRPGKNVLAVEGWNDGQPAGLILTAEIKFESGESVKLQSDSSFETLRAAPPGWTAVGFDAADVKPAVVYGPLGIAPWGLVARAVEPVYRTQPGFRVETVARGIGSILAIALDGSGGLYASREGGGIVHLTDKDGDGVLEPGADTLDAVKSCQGLVCVQGALYAIGEGPRGPGLYKIEFGVVKSGPRPVEFLGAFQGIGGEHGAHGIVLGPDKRLYIAVGNHHQIVAPSSQLSAYKITYDGSLLPYLEDPLGHAVGIRAPGGTVVSVDTEGKDWRVVAGGFRNHYDLTFSQAGDLFTFDSDMEWDVGLPWYRAVRVVHVVEGGEYGWRSGAACWPEYYCDSLPPVVETGRGSPTGLTFYGGKRFPARFHGALLLGDWSKGEILACHLTVKGTSYGGTTEALLSGSPLNVTDLEVDNSGALLFSTGGRGTAGGIHRLVFEGEADTSETRPAVAERAPALENLTAILTALESGDRFLRFRAARALEERHADLDVLRRPLSDRVKGEVAVALARHGLTLADSAFSDNVFRVTSQLLTASGAGTHPMASLTEARLAYLRALEIALLHPKSKVRRGARDLLLPLMVVFPTGDWAIDRQLAALLAFGAPAGVIEKLLDQIEAQSSRAEAIHFAYCLRCVKDGWSAESRKRFLTWTAAARAWSGGASFGGYLDAILLDMKPVFTSEEWAAAVAPPPPPIVVAAGDPKNYDSTLTFLAHTRNAARRGAAEGALLYKDLCSRCHLFGDAGGRVGPDLTTVSGRFSLAEQLQATLRPSAAVSDQYRAWILTAGSGQLYSGLRAGERDGKVSLVLGSGEVVNIARSDVASLEPSSLSLMPEGLLDALTLEQIGDLFTYMNTPNPPATPAASEWSSLFDGKTLDGWDGDSNLWSVDSGEIFGKASGLPGSRFLVSKKRYSDFILEFDVKLMTGNSGLQFRAELPAPHVLTGYQADIGQSYWGALYEEGGRGMLAQPAVEIWSSAVKPREFNHYVVSAIGEHIQIELNGVVTVDLDDRSASRGFLGFQLHGGIDNGVRLRNIRIRDMSSGSSSVK